VNLAEAAARPEWRLVRRSGRAVGLGPAGSASHVTESPLLLEVAPAGPKAGGEGDQAPAQPALLIYVEKIYIRRENLPNDVVRHVVRHVVSVVSDVVSDTSSATRRQRRRQRRSSASAAASRDRRVVSIGSVTSQSGPRSVAPPSQRGAWRRVLASLEMAGRGHSDDMAMSPAPGSTL
jgi:hypothetical protein